MDIQYKEPLKAIQFNGSNFEEIEYFLQQNEIPFQKKSETFCWAENNRLQIGDWFVIIPKLIYNNKYLIIVPKEEFDRHFISI